MPETIITSLEQVTPEWLTTVLTRQGAIAGGRVLSVDAESGGGNWSTNARFHMTYSKDAQGDLPARLFLKMCRSQPDDDYGFNDSEVNYYTRDYVDVPDAPLVRCYHAGYSAAPPRYHLLLDDMSDTHILSYEREWTLDALKPLVTGLAAMHARWWGPARLAELGEPIHTAADIERYVAIGQPGVEPILTHYSDQLEPHWPDLIRSTFSKHKQLLIERTLQSANQTVIHGDVNPTNIMVPREGNGPIYLLDRQPFNWGLTTWLGIYDLLYATVYFIEVSQRQQFEKPLLRHYHTELKRHGVKDYSWEQFLEDFRLALPVGIYIYTEYCAEGIDEELEFVWLTALKRTLTAMDEWGCAGMW